MHSQFKHTNCLITVNDKCLADLNTICYQFIESSKGTNYCITICVLPHHTDSNYLLNTVNIVIQTSDVSQESYI